jgi:CRP-like cAMP-binding protein
MNIKDWVFTRKNLHFKKGDVVFNKQDEGKEMYFIDSGDIEIVKTIGDVNLNIASLSSGDFLGEMSLITGSRRVASAIAMTDCNIHVMDKKAFMSNISNNRDFVNRVLLSLARRLEEVDLSFTLLYKEVSESSKS